MAVENNEKREEGLRYNTGKTRHDLVPAFAQEQYAKVLTKGSEKYEGRNWEKGMSWTGVLASMKRHIQKFEAGEDFDDETGLLHMANVMCNAAFITEFYQIAPQYDDRPLRNDVRISLDIDEVLCNWLGAWKEYWGIEDDTHAWYFDREIGEKFDIMKREGNLVDFYAGLKPLIDPKDIHFEPHCYITSRPVPKEVTEAWLDLHGFPARPVYTVDADHSKVDVFKASGADVHVDDRYENMVDLRKNGIFCYLYTQPHNARYDVGHARINYLSDLDYRSKRFK